MRPEGGGRHDINIAAVRFQGVDHLCGLGSPSPGGLPLFQVYKRVRKVEDHYINIMPAVAVSIKAT